MEPLAGVKAQRIAAREALGLRNLSLEKQEGVYRCLGKKWATLSHNCGGFWPRTAWGCLGPRHISFQEPAADPSLWRRPGEASGVRGARAPPPGRNLALPGLGAPAGPGARGRGSEAEASGRGRWEGAGGARAVGQLQVSSWSRCRARRRAGPAM